LQKLKDSILVKDGQIIQANEALDYCIDYAKCGSDEEVLKLCNLHK
jgi:hypothetical protein